MAFGRLSLQDRTKPGGEEQMRSAIRAVLATGVLAALATSAAAQVHYEAQPRPIVTANNESWYQLGEPITFEGHFYHLAGPQVFFNTNTMVRTGSYRGVPLYADTTIEPYSRVFVPLAGGLMQPYERRREGELAGSTGSQAPSFPVAIASETTDTPIARTPQAAAPPMLGPAPAPIDQPVASPDLAPIGPPSAEAPGVAATSGVLPPPPPRRQLVQAGAKPRGLNEVFVNYEGYRWRSAGVAVEWTAEAFEVVGEYRGYPVYADRGAGKRVRRIYLPSRPGLVAPYERAGRPVTY
jgi:hypothetical protein